MNAQVTPLDVSGSPAEGPVRLFGLALIGLLVVAAITVWLLVARSPFIQEDDMDQPSRVGQLYGYAVCLIAVLIGVFTVNSLINNAVTLALPGAALQANYFQPSLTSFEAYLATRGQERQTDAGAAATAPRPDTLSPPELRTRYEALRGDRLAREREDALRSLISSAVLLALGIVLFVVHWRWLGHSFGGRRPAARVVPPQVG